MRSRKISLALALVAVAMLVFGSVAHACTIVAVGKDATTDGSTMITHNDDSSVADYRLWIIPEQDWPEGSTRDIVVDGHNYTGGTVVGTMPQVPHTYRYFHSRYSFMNEKGVAMGESTFSYDRNTPREQEIYNTMVKNSPGVIDCWLAQDIALERASTAREAVRIMGDLVEQYGWLGPGETMDITDGEEVWVAEFYGHGVWAAVRIPDDHFFVAANRARIGEIDLNDKENVMASPDIVSFAVEKGWYDPNSGKPFVVYENYAPCESLYASRREWRAFDLVAPSLGLSPHDYRFPLSVKPERKLSVQDIWDIKADYYAGTEYDLSKGPAAGPWGSPLRYPNSDPRGGAYERSINMHRTCYLHIGQVKSWLPDPIKGISWYGYGAPDTTYLTPLWPAMKELPKFYQVGTRYEEFRRDSGWWVNTYVQEIAHMRYQAAVKDIHAFRNPRMEMLYQVTPKVQEIAAELYKTDPEAALSLIHEFAYTNAVAWHEDWKLLGDRLLGKYAFGSINMKATPFPQWWNDLIEFKPLER
ncbi:MAG: C69 family dipeptidase [Firmicutes bacterium]|jgi:dipeptidase|nr:C69 family dipeptidase [Bacillota bacterium]